jgi:SpoVK/Ycf46/Vps4 family AAA+-type ATPase
MADPKVTVTDVKSILVKPSVVADKSFLDKSPKLKDAVNAFEEHYNKACKDLTQVRTQAILFSMLSVITSCKTDKALNNADKGTLMAIMQPMIAHISNEISKKYEGNQALKVTLSDVHAEVDKVIKSSRPGMGSGSSVT